MSINPFSGFGIILVSAFILCGHADAVGQSASHESAKNEYGTVIEISIGEPEEPNDIQRPILGELKYGRYAAGFSVLASRDSTRTMPDGHPRAVQIGVWYPAQAAKDKMSYRDYIALSANESDHHTATDAEKQAAVGSFKEFGISVGTPETAMEQWLSAEMYAGYDARQSDGEFPVVIVAQGNFQAAADQAFLCEYLASHGYIVATSPFPARIIGPMKTSDDVYPMALDQKKRYGSYPSQGHVGIPRR